MAGDDCIEIYTMLHKFRNNKWDCVLRIPSLNRHFYCNYASSFSHFVNCALCIQSYEVDNILSLIFSMAGSFIYIFMKEHCLVPLVTLQKCFLSAERPSIYVLDHGKPLICPLKMKSRALNWVNHSIGEFLLAMFYCNPKDNHLLDMYERCT